MNNEDSETTDAHGGSLGLVLILVGLFFVVMARGVAASGVGENSDPGPRLVPTVLGWCVVAGGLWESWRWWRGRGTKRSKAGGGPGRRAWVEAFWAERNRDVLYLAAMMAVYLAAMPWAGFLLSTWLFSGVMLMRLGVRWWKAGLIGVGFVVVIQLVFVELFSIQLPAGRLGLPL